MKANLYLHPDAFSYNDIDSEADVRKKLSKLIDDISKICNSKECSKNCFYSNMKLGDCKVYKDLPLWDFAAKNLDSEARTLFFNIIVNTSEDIPEDISYDELRDMCKYDRNEEEVHSLLVMNYKESEECANPYMQFDNYELVYNYSSWTTLRRQILGNHPGEPTDFIKECKCYFDSLIFSDTCVRSLDSDFQYLKIIPRKLVYYLSCLNDRYKGVYEKYGSKGINETCLQFSGKYRLDKAGSREGKPEAKGDLKFEFKVGENTYRFYCEAHLKISTPDDNYHGNKIKKFNPRIYFFANECLKEKGKIYVGSIGKHL